MKSRHAWLALPLLAAVWTSGCSGMQRCTDVGGWEGVGVGIPQSLFVRAGGTVAVEVCDAEGCSSANTRLGPVPEGPVGRSVGVTFDDLGRTFDPGQVTVTVELTRPDGELVASARREVELTRSYPNGKACDGDGYVGGSLTLEPSDRV